MHTKLTHAITKTPFRRLVAGSFLFVLVWRVLLEAVNQLVSHTTIVIPYWPDYLQWVNAPANAPPLGLGHWAHWDGYHFLGIILRGYHQVGLDGAHSETAFFPAFPTLVRVPSRLLHLDPVLVGLAINFALSVVIAVALYKLALLMCERYLPKAKLDEHRLARLSVLLFFLYPASFFLAAFYADALVVAGATLAIYFALRQRYVLSSISAFTVISAKTTVVARTVLVVATAQSSGADERARDWPRRLHALFVESVWRSTVVFAC